MNTLHNDTGEELVIRIGQNVPPIAPVPKHDETRIFQLVDPEKSTALHQKAVPFDFSNPPIDPIFLARDLINTMSTLHGIGLAAPQIGASLRVFAMRVNPFAENYIDTTAVDPSTPLYKNAKADVVMFNPEVISVGETEDWYQEGCLSFPGLMIKIKRPTSVKFSAYDLYGTRFEDEFTGINARCFLHEFDHLNGILFTTRVGPAALMMARKKQSKIIKSVTRRKAKR